MRQSSPSAPPKVYGWCPGALRPMMSGDGLVVRVRAPLGRLTAAQVRGIARLSDRFGNGLLDLSARANLQLRGIREETHADLITGLRELGLIDPDTQAEARRNLLLSPFWRSGDDTHTIATELSAALTAATELSLPAKFGFAVDCGTSALLQDTAADIRIERGQTGLILRADGASHGKAVTAQTAVSAALDLAHWFLDQGGAPEGRGRMHRLIAHRGLPPAHEASQSTGTPPPPSPGSTAAGQLVALEFGQIPAKTLLALADYGALRLTPWRMLLLESNSAPPPLPGLILDATDPRLQVHVCTGAPGCLQALSPTRDLARDLAKHVPEKASLHISGCAKGCAHPSPADLVLRASGPDTFDLIRRGTASDQSLRETLTAAALRANPAILTEGS